MTFVKVRLPGLGVALEGVKVLHLTDLHLLRIGQNERTALEVAQRLKPDMVVITGDLCRRWSISAGIRFLNSLEAPFGIFFVPGNHDGRTLNLLQTKAPKVRFLSNRSWLIERDGARLAIVGVDDPHRERDDMETALGDVPEGIPILLLAHSPDVAYRPGFEKVSLCLSGHTHGGQVCFFPGRAIYTHTRHKLPSSGLHFFRGALLYISRGVGRSLILPLRFLCPPEVVVVELSGAEGSDLHAEIVSRAHARHWLREKA